MVAGHRTGGFQWLAADAANNTIAFVRNGSAGGQLACMVNLSLPDCRHGAHMPCAATCFPAPEPRPPRRTAAPQDTLPPHRTCAAASPDLRHASATTVQPPNAPNTSANVSDVWPSTRREAAPGSPGSSTVGDYALIKNHVRRASRRTRTITEARQAEKPGTRVSSAITELVKPVTPTLAMHATLPAMSPIPMLFSFSALAMTKRPDQAHHSG